MAAPAPADGELYTRGGPNMPDLRGVSMVAAHQEKMQKDKEEKAMEKLRILLPHINPAVHVLALQESDWDDGRALISLRKFSAAHAADLKSLQKQRQRHLMRPVLQSLICMAYQNQALYYPMLFLRFQTSLALRLALVQIVLCPCFCPLL